jgi:ferredoxin-NADP reductase
LPIGAGIAIEGPFGSLTLHNDRTRPAVCIAVRIGITPFMSIVRQAAHDGLRQRLVLLYSNRRPEDAAYLAELGGAQVRFELPDAVERAGYSTATKAILDGSRIAGLGYAPRYDVRAGLERTVRILKELG